MTKKNKYAGSSLEDFLEEEGICKEAKGAAVTRVISWQIAEEMKKQGINKVAMAKKMGTSRSQVDRILKAEGNVTVEVLQRAASIIGREIHLELV